MLVLALVLAGCLFRLALLVPWAIERLKESDQSSCEKLAVLCGVSGLYILLREILSSTRQMPC